MCTSVYINTNTYLYITCFNFPIFEFVFISPCFSFPPPFPQAVTLCSTCDDM